MKRMEGVGIKTQGFRSPENPESEEWATPDVIAEAEREGQVLRWFFPAGRVGSPSLTSLSLSLSLFFFLLVCFLFICNEYIFVFYFS